MTVKKTTRCGGYASVVTRQKLPANQQLDIATLGKTTANNYNVIVGFNEKDQLQLLTKEDSNDDDKKIKDYDARNKYENIPIDDITNCVNVENYPNCENILVFYVSKNLNKEAIALRFENEQDFKRIYFTYKYFKMRNRLTMNIHNYTSTESLFSKKKPIDTYNYKKHSFDDYSLYDKTKPEYDLTDNDGLTHLSVLQKGLSRFDQPLSLIGISSMKDVSEIDSIIFPDIDVAKPDRKKLFQKKPKPPVLYNNESYKVLRGEFVRVNVERTPDPAKDNKSKDVPSFRDTKPRKINTNSSLWSASNKGHNGYESDREEWKSSRSQFSTTAFDSLTRPTKTAMALTLKKPPRLDPIPQYYRLTNDNKPKHSPLPFRPNNYTQRPPRLPRPNTENKRNLMTADHRKYVSLQNLDIPKKGEPKKQNDIKKSNYSNLSTKITGLTNKLRDLSTGSTIGRFKAQSHGDVTNLKPVLKMNDGPKRSVVRTCSAEPPKKVTFSAFATVQVV
ncbi:uncharacterized protein LOC121728150 [Aricia agestis]|uniref:uncharacterized protein LOC121728150 n=1 Tax=Aricia agestis TaxID=91739 RepID=UPI001C2016A9|nr:uncharacterized protein LOC121728150 [Aricia agestis]